MVENIVIVGGGSSGWCTAAYMSRFLKGVRITLIESSDIPVIGVGESTLPPIVDFMQSLDISEHDWLARCNGTIKSSIRFKDFHKIGEPEIWFPFEPVEIVQGRPLSRYWHYRHINDPGYKDRFSFYEYNFLVPELCRMGKTVKSIPGASYAYHVDAGLWGEVLKERAVAEGVNHIVDTITSVNRSEDGNIRSLSRDNGPDLEADLFIDCSGFQSLLLDKTLNEPFDDYYDYLFNDKAVAMRIPYRDKESEMVSFTNCHALTSGWVWTVPLYNRLGTGYVYCGAYKTPEQAEQELREHLGIERTKDCTAKHLDIRVGKHHRTWVNNCVAIGLSAGFIEPLESTGLFIVQGAVQLLTNILAKNSDYNAGDRQAYNDSITRLLEIIRDFLVCHYALTEREDTPYWKDVKYTTRISDTLSEKLQLARLVMPDAQHINRFDNASLAGFSFNDGWQCILTGMDYLPFQWEQLRQNQAGPFDPHIKSNMHIADQRQAQRDTQKQQLANLPSHYSYLKETFYDNEE